MNPDQIREAIAYLDAFLRAMPYDADGNVRSMEADEQTRFDEGLAERERLAGLLAQHERVQALAPVNGVPGDAPAPFNVNRNADPFDLSDLRYDATASEVRGRAVTALEQVRGLADADRAHVTELVERRGGEVIGRVLATGSDAYRSAAAKLMTGNAHMLDDAERAAVVRAQSLADAEGGYAVPFTLDPTIMLTNAGAESAIRQLARTATITTNAWNGVSSAGTSVTYHGEAEEVGDDSITLAQPTVPVHRYDVFIPYSFEAGQDWQGFEGDMRMVMQDARARKD
ncbi:MAG TPA: phage major capsid protein, partial [Acidimicrobiales bacterium]|nr:phage major capsid protein [Acidimicrobiales bacterium]